MPSLLLRPGVAVRLKKQPPHVPDFLVMACESDRAWIRQPEWPTHIQLCVRVTQLSIPTQKGAHVINVSEPSLFP